MTNSYKDTQNYYKIYWQLRNELGLTNNEFILCQAIYGLSRNVKCLHPGWCYASKEKLGEFVGINRRSIQYLIIHLEESGHIIRDLETKWLTTTDKFNTIFDPDRCAKPTHHDAKPPQEVRKNPAPNDAKTPPNYNNKDIIKTHRENNKGAPLSSSKKNGIKNLPLEQKPELIEFENIHYEVLPENVIDFQEGMNIEFSDIELYIKYGFIKKMEILT